MNILWIVNIVFPEANALLNKNKELKSSGGWMLGAANALTDYPNVKLNIASLSPLVDDLTVLQGNRIRYFVIPLGGGNIKYNKEYEKYWKLIKEQVQPDVVHIHGTEYSHGLAYVNACGNESVAVSIQGLKSAISEYYMAGLSKMDVYSNLTLRDVLRGSIIADKRRFEKTGGVEKALLTKVNHIIGRTSWDRARTWAINPNAKYHFCNETLRDEFYDGSKWNYQDCKPHSIFISQATYPIKGFHQLIKALPLILRHYSDTTVRVAGGDPTKCNGINGLLHYTGYGKYLRRLIEKNSLSKKIVFLGGLNAEQMKNEYLHCNVFVCPSSIENSPNSLGEAQLLGVPCVASYVGGIPDMMKGDDGNMYRFEEVEMMAEKICRVFAGNICKNNMVEIAKERHNPQTNSLQLLNIYNEIKGRKITH